MPDVLQGNEQFLAHTPFQSGSAPGSSPAGAHWVRLIPQSSFPEFTFCPTLVENAQYKASQPAVLLVSCLRSDLIRPHSVSGVRDLSVPLSREAGISNHSGPNSGPAISGDPLSDRRSRTGGNRLAASVPHSGQSSGLNRCRFGCALCGAIAHQSLRVDVSSA